MRRSRRIAWLIVLVLVAVLAIAFIPACSTPSSASQPAPPTAMIGGVIDTPILTDTAHRDPAKHSIFTGANLTKRVVLTYDDCPRSIKEFKESITYANTHGIGLVIFPIGDCVRKYRKQGFDLVAYARARGIWVGNHSKSHPDTFPYLSRSQVIAQIKGTVVANYGRPPYGALRSGGHGISKAVKSAYASIATHGRSGMRIWNWTVDTNDWRGKSRGAIANWAIKYSRAGGTVLMHMNWRGFNPWTIRHIRDGLAKKGLKLCRIWRGTDHKGVIEPTSAFFPDNIC